MFRFGLDETDLAPDDFGDHADQRRGNGGYNNNFDNDANAEKESLQNRFEEVRVIDEIDEKLGFYRYTEGPEKLGWMVNMHPTLLPDKDWAGGKSGVDFYFIEEDGATFKATILYEPYFFIVCKPNTESDVEDFLRRKFEQTIVRIDRVKKEDLDLPNHLLGHQRDLLKLSFHNMTDLLAVRKVVLPAAKKNKKYLEAAGAYEDMAEMPDTGGMPIGYEVDDVALSRQKAAAARRAMTTNALENVIDIREYDVPYYVRAAIDNDFRVGLWYSVKSSNDGTGKLTIEHRTDKVKRAEPVVFAFDIETTKMPLKFPDAETDAIMMISYMIDGQGFLITNREIVSMDIEDFEYTPKPEYEGVFTIFNEPDEVHLLRRFFEHIQQVRPTVFVTYNGDSFDWPFVDTRARIHGMDMYQEIGFKKDDQDEYKSSYSIHMDCFRWVKRDSYLPVGSQGLKAVTTAKLGYNPMELDPEDMTRFATERPQVLAQYSVSDAVATYYLYMKYVNPFIFSLCNIIPLNPDEVLRKGSGTLCEMLLMVQAYKANVLMPNKHVDEQSKFYEGRLLESETYVGGHVKALEAGVFRSDLPTHFKVVPEAVQNLIDQVDQALKFSIEVEAKLSMDDIANYDEVRNEIVSLLENLRDSPNRHETPLIYHLDVAAMYPNIILTNRLQPDALIDEATCASCDFNKPGKECQRVMPWSWRGEFFPAKRNEYNMIINQLEVEKFPGRRPNAPMRKFSELPPVEQNALIKKRITEYSRKVYKKIHESKVVERESIICQRENPFYVNTVRQFRDRRYDYKTLHKVWKKNLETAAASGEGTSIDEAKKMIVLYDSLQLAHKCILNSFYGYVMRKGSRWYSMEMAGIVCLTGAKIIQMACSIVEKIGRPLELDTDGIWCILPSSFPENFTFKLKNGKKNVVSYPCTMLNHLVHAQFTNHQYQELVDAENHSYVSRSENSIFFEVDGPYRAMILPSSTEADKLLKKRYAVFNDDGSLAELKGFEVKRRGELKLIKIFQSQIFKVFLDGSTLEECYASVAKVANQWLDVLHTKGADLSDHELFDLISENRSMSKSLEEYGSQKSTSISTARRLAEFLGDQMVKDAGLACQFIISSKPPGLPVSERAIPVAIFFAEPSVKKHFLRKWLKDNSMNNFDIRGLLDWNYYLERFGSVIQKLITIPAAWQKVKNPIPRVEHPEWLSKRIREKDDKMKQRSLVDMFKTSAGSLNSKFGQHDTDDAGNIIDIEDGLSGATSSAKFGSQAGALVAKVNKSSKVLGKRKNQEEEEEIVLPEVMPDMLTDYQGWLQYQKLKWRKLRREREKLKKLYGTDAASRTKLLKSMTADGASSFFRRQAESIFFQPWEVLQIVETDTPGEFRIWALVSGNLHSIKLFVPRIFYANMSTVPDKIELDVRVTVEKVTRTLPRSHPCLHLYKFTMSETAFIELNRSLNMVFNHPSMEGVYETQVPLSFRALLSLGCVVTVSKEKMSSGRNAEDGFNLYDLSRDSNASTSYMENSKLNYLYLYHANVDNRHVFGLFSTVNGSSRVSVVIADPGRQNAVGNLARQYAERRAAKMNGESLPQEASQNEDVEDAVMEDGSESKSDKKLFDYPEELEFNTTIVSSLNGAYKALARAVGQYKDERRGPTVLAFHSPRSVRSFTDAVPLLKDFPTVSIPSHKKDNNFPALDWQRWGCRRMIAHFMNLDVWLLGRIKQARYADVPFCNIESDYPIFVSDITLGRRLIKQDMLLWCSLSSKPDLGGSEFDDNSQIVDELITPEINVPGAYENVCVEIDLFNLAVNTVLASSHINELEGASSVGMGFDGSIAADGVHRQVNSDQISVHQFNAIKSTLKSWSVEFMQKESGYSDMMLEHFFRWLTSPTSKLYDPALYAFIHQMMRKVFMQLLAEFKKLGSQIVHANFNRLVIATSKDSISNAMEYSKWIIKSIRGKPLFDLVQLEPTHYWDYLLWMDIANYGGIAHKYAGSMEGTEDAMDIAEGDSEDLMIDVFWNIKDYLPPAIQDEFQSIMGEFIFKIYRFRSDLRKKRLNGSSPHRHKKDAKADDDNIIVTEEVTFKRQMVLSVLQRKLAKLVPEIDRNLTGMHTNEEDQLAASFPHLPGSHLHLNNAGLEFVKYICALLELDKTIIDQVRILRRNLLNLIGVGEFSPEATFVNPCETFRLRQVICDYCNFCRDLDLCRDRDLMPSAQGEPAPWLCPGCSTEYDKLALEQMLVDIVQRRLLAYQLQDIKCGKCGLVKADTIQNHCNCSGGYRTVLSSKDFAKKMKVFLNVSKFHNMDLLREVVEWVAEVNGVRSH